MVRGVLVGYGADVDEVERLLARAAEVDPVVNAICTLNPRALEQAAALDAERAAGRACAP